jgi:predicted NBD/HSP70 family sugar kinase
VEFHPTFWGIDLGGSKIEGIVLDSLEELQPRCRLRIETEAGRGYEHILAQICGLIERLKNETGRTPARIGIGHPGLLDPRTQLLKNSNTQCLNGRALKRDLEEKCGVPLESANDANCFALAEACFGAAKNARVVFGVILGTGVGGGIVIDKRVLAGAQGIAGEWGHNILLPGGANCYCGKQGCVETILSGPALEAFYAAESGAPRSLTEICERAEGGEDTAAAATIRRASEWFGRAIAVVINILDPDCVVLGGGLSNMPHLYTEGRSIAERNTFNDSLTTPIVPNALGDSAGVFGAAMLTQEEGAARSERKL